MKKAIHKIIATLMAFVVLFSTMSFTINSHFCGGSLVGISYFVKAKTCGMETKQENQINKKDCAVSKKNCCKDETKVIQGQDNLKDSSLNILSFNQQVFILSFVYSYINILKEVHDKVIPFKDYSPPFVVKNIQLLDELYLI